MPGLYPESCVYFVHFLRKRLRDIEPMDGPTVFALLRKRGGRWRVVTHSIGPTDVVWGGRDKEFDVPSVLLGKR